jgi:protein O-mannosyl-transferase
VSEPTQFRRLGLVCLVLVLTTLALYWPVRHFDFVQYDDPEYVSENDTVRQGVTTYGLLWSVVDAHAANWHPLTWVSHMIDSQFFGLHPGAHHMVNVFLHCANSALLLVLLHALTGAFWRSTFVAAFFAWHPLRVESVAWISERKDVLSGLFFMLTVVAYLRYVRLGPGGSQLPDPESGFTPLRQARSRKWYWWSVSLFAAGLLCKPMLVTVPCILLLLDFWPLQRVGSQIPPALRGLKGLLVEKLPFFLLSFGVGLITIWAQKSGGAVASLGSVGLVDRLATAMTGYADYLGRIFWPQNLSFLYLRPQSWSLLAILGSCLVIGTISVVAWRQARRWPYFAVGWLWFLIMVLPVSGLVQTGLQFVADRYTYLPLIGIAILVVWGCAGGVGQTQPLRIFFTSVAGLALLACILCTRQQIAYWRNTESLMEHALEVDPHNYIAYHNLAVYLSKQGRVDDARHCREMVTRLDPSLRGAPNGLHTGMPNE